MILISSEGDRLEVEDQHATYSPYLDAATVCSGTTTVTLDRLSTREVEAYISFLRGGVPRMDVSLERAFDFMGHPNVLRYSSDYWTIKLHDNWVRDNMYRLNLLDDPFYDLEEIPVKEEIHIKPLSKGIYVAGGYALYLSGYTRASSGHLRLFSDMDLFTTSKETMEEFLLDLGAEVHVQENVMNIPARKLCSMNSHVNGGPCKGQVILRLYKAPTEIVHGFDLDCCGFLLSYDDGTPRLWATKRAIWAAKNGINWFDPDRMSPSYSYRMAKYMTRGFRPMLPFLHDLITPIKDKFDDRVYAIYDAIRRKFEITLIHYDQETCYSYFASPVHSYERDLSKIVDIFRRHRMIPKMNQISALLMTLGMFGDSDLESPGTQMGVLMRIYGQNREETEWLVPQDPASMVILAAMEGFYASSWTGFDYEKDCLHEYEDVTEDMLQDLTWRTLDPMSQLSGTFHPEPIRDLKAWYLTSPLLEGRSS